MRAINYISILAILALGSCTSSIYTGVEYDDLYYQRSDQPITRVKSPAVRQAPERNLQAKDYYDNIYAADTLLSDEYSDAIANNDSLSKQNYNYNFDSYSGRLRSFYGNYFYPYWRDPYYMGWGYPSMYMGYDPFFYDPFSYGYGDYGWYGGMYSPFYGGYYGGMYGGYYGGMYGGYYGGMYGGYYGNYYNIISDRNPIAYGRREIQSNYSSSWNKTMNPATASSRRSGYMADGSRSYTPTNRSYSNGSSSRRSAAAGAYQSNSRMASVNARSSVPTSRSSATSRPEYNSTSRNYTPSYSNPRMSTRPTYNNSRVSTENNSNRSYSNTSSYRGTPSRSGSSISSGQSRSSSSYNQGSSYSTPSRRSVESGSGYSSGSFNSGRSSSSGSESRSSYSSGSSSGGYSGSRSSSSGSSGSSSGGSSGGSSGSGRSR